MTTEAATRRTPGAPCWVSLMVHGLSATQAFYGALFGWEFRPGPRQVGPYVRAFLGEREVAGIGALAPGRETSVAWTPYFASADADVTAEHIRCCGGTVAVGPLDADRSRMVVASDPRGAVFGVWQGGEATGAAAVDVPGTLVWNELVVKESKPAASFYEAVFGFEATTGTEAPDESGVPSAGAEEPDHRTLWLKGRAVAGIRGVGDALPRDRGPHWMTYFAVADADAAVRRVAELGGRVVRPAWDAAYGRVATVADPEGAVFGVVRRG
ncbi:VOC family protein [Streptomyces sp. NPDC003077]|uniref:VOC family protein n=1 Tax=Streptomyces sp. NPDC003077 TaxID=3154443 RepID=UPI0033BD6E55